MGVDRTSYSNTRFSYKQHIYKQHQLKLAKIIKQKIGNILQAKLFLFQNYSLS